VFATQSLADIERSCIAPALIESCPTRIFLPNERALEPQARAVYERFGLNARQIEILSVAAPKRDYYAQTARGNRLFELGLGPVALALCGASTPDDQRCIDRCLAAGAPGDLAARFLDAKGLGWAAELLRHWPPSPSSQPRPAGAAVEQGPTVPVAAPGAVAATAHAPHTPTAAPHAPAPAAQAPARGPHASPAAGAAGSVPAPRPSPPLPGLPGGPPLSHRLSPYRIAPGQPKRRRP